MKQEDLAAKAAVALERMVVRFKGEPALIFAPGPSLPELWSTKRELPCPAIVVNDAWRIVPNADILYATDLRWWVYYNQVPEFNGLRVSWGGDIRLPGDILYLADSGLAGFDPRLGWVRHCWNSGGAAIHLAAQLGANPILLVGFDMRAVGGKEHFFGDHPRDIQRGSPYELWFPPFASLAADLAQHRIRVLNCTPGSALTAFPMADLELALGAEAWPNTTVS
jgi:hypothetical protein